MVKMTKKEVIDLMAHFILISVSKNGAEIIDNLITPEQVDKMMKIIVSEFKSDEKKAEMFIINRIKKLLVKLDQQEVKEDQKNTFKKDDEK